MTQPAPLNPQQVPLGQAVASLGAAPLPAPQAPAAPEPAPIPVHTGPFSVSLVDARGEHPISVATAKLQLTRSGVNPTEGTIELRAKVHGDPALSTLLSVAGIAAPYTIVLKYYGSDGSVLRADNVSVNPTSRLIYHGPEISETETGWEFFETLTIHA